MNKPNANRILIVDDDKQICALMNGMIQEKMATEIDIANSFEEARQWLTEYQEKYFIAIVDLNLPDSVEHEIVDYMIEKKIPVIALTEFINDDLREKLVARDIVDYIIKTKTGEFDHLAYIVNRIYNNKFLKALVVDDSSVSRHHIRRLLENQCLMVFEAKDGLEALEVFNGHPDLTLVVTDYNMPRMNGLELITEIRRKYSRNEVAIIGISSHGAELLSAKLLKNGASDFLIRPFLNEEFSLRVMQTISAIEHIRELREISYEDFLTGLNNRRYFFENASKLFDMADRGNMKMYVLMIDIDNFKIINDTYGHEVGDMVLKHIANIIKHNTRNGDISSRIGGEEFCIMATGNNHGGGNGLAERLRRIVESHPFTFGDLAIQVTVSIGICAYIPESLNKMLKIADQALYVAKNGGRNQVHCTYHGQDRKVRVLIVEDDKNMAKSIQRVLKKAGYETHIAYSGFEAGVLLENILPDVLTLDLMMPELDGEAVLDAIKETRTFHAMKILVISGSHINELKRLVQKGAHDYLAKPFDNDLLLRKVSDLVETQCMA